MRQNFCGSLSLAGLISALSLATGCDKLDQAAGNAPAPNNQGTTVVAQQFLPPEPAGRYSTPSSDAAATPDAGATDPATATDPSADQLILDMPADAQPGAAAGTELHTPEGSDSAKGQGYGGGVITEPVSQYFNLQYRIMFLQLENQSKTWKALNNRNPKDFDEYKKEIMEPCGVSELPELRANCRYVYDAKTGEVLVETKTGQ